MRFARGSRGRAVLEASPSLCLSEKRHENDVQRLLEAEPSLGVRRKVELVDRFGLCFSPQPQFGTLEGTRTALALKSAAVLPMVRVLWTPDPKGSSPQSFATGGYDDASEEMGR